MINVQVSIAVVRWKDKKRNGAALLFWQENVYFRTLNSSIIILPEFIMKQFMLKSV